MVMCWPQLWGGGSQMGRDLCKAKWLVSARAWQGAQDAQSLARTLPPPPPPPAAIVNEVTSSGCLFLTRRTDTFPLPVGVLPAALYL